MAGTGAIRVVSGSGNRKGADGSGTRTAIAIRGMDLLDRTTLVRRNRRIAGGGLCPVRMAAAATIHRHRQDTATAASTVTST